MKASAVIGFAVRANGAAWPKQSLKVLAGLVVSQSAEFLKGHLVGPVVVYVIVDKGVSIVNEFVDKRERFLGKHSPILQLDGVSTQW